MITTLYTSTSIKREQTVREERKKSIMGLILNYNVEETKILSAHGLTVYGKINRYLWTLDQKEENALINLRIVSNIDNTPVFSMDMGNRCIFTPVFSMDLGNRCIFQARVDDTLDNFLYWIATEKPDVYSIKKQVYKSLCQSDSLFNYLVEQRRLKKKNR